MIFFLLPIFINFFSLEAGKTGNHLGYASIGCWHLPENDTTVFKSLEGLNEDLEGFYWDRVYPVTKCGTVAKNKGYKYFAVRNGGECLSGSQLYKMYKTHGKSEECVDGEGGHEAMNVYNITGTIPALDDFEGDILLTKVQQAMTMPLHRDVADAGVWDKAEYLWPERTVPYYIPPNLVGHVLSSRFQLGMRHWREQTCVRFVRKKGHRDWVELYREKNPLSRRCASSIGRIGGYQPIKLGDYCPSGSVIHEVGHALGLWHTQSRPDRDSYVRIIWNNILPGKSDQFKIYSHGIVGTQGIQYDYMSIMHYGKDYFGKLDSNKRHYLTTIQTLDPSYQNRIGQRQKLTATDILMINTLYGCPDYPYMWHTSDWNGCSVLCGSGRQKREVYCAKDGWKRVPPQFCSKTKVPLNTRKCYGRKCGKCPVGWVSFSNACYQVNPGKKNLQEARDSCLNSGAGILTLRSWEEETALRTELGKKNANNIFYWLGAKYSPSKGAFFWPDNTEVVYNAWNKGEPRWGLDCAIMLNERGWGTERCDMKRSYICKKELKAYKRSKVEIEKPKRYAWLAEDWGQCSVSCGGGQRFRKILCAGKDEIKVDDWLCEDPSPDAWERCNAGPCPPAYHWHVEDWGQCSRSCGGGVKRRKKMCANKDMIPTSWKLCKETTPQTKKRCNVQPCPVKRMLAPSPPLWRVSAWSKCSKTCGYGYRMRGIFCSRSDNKPLEGISCERQRKPTRMKKCFVKACPGKKVHRCSDKHVMCKVWKKQGSCKTSKWVKETCRRGCRTC